MVFCNKNGSTPASFLFYFHSFPAQIEKTVGFTGIRTQIVGVEGKHTDHMTSTWASKEFAVKSKKESGSAKELCLEKQRR